MPLKKRDWSIDRNAVKALVAVYGPREAARQANIPPGTVFSWCRRYNWRKADRLTHTNGINGDPSVPAKKDAGDAITAAMAKHKQESTLHLAQFTTKAAKQASKLKDPLSKARAVRDVAQVYNTLYPPEDGGELLEGAILIGGAAVTDNPAEMLAMTEVLEDVRQELPDQRPESH